MKTTLKIGNIPPIGRVKVNTSVWECKPKINILSRLTLPERGVKIRRASEFATLSREDYLVTVRGFLGPIPKLRVLEGKREGLKDETRSQTVLSGIPAF